MKKSKMIQRLQSIALISLTIVLLSAAVVYALIITVDGDVSDWTAAANVQTDANEASINDQWDVEQVFFTNDATRVYMRWDTFVNTGCIGTFQLVCIDNDNNPITGGAVSQCDGTVGVSMQGVDYVLRIVECGDLGFQVRQCEDTDLQWQDCAVVSGTSTDSAYSGVYTEIGVDLADIGYGTPPTCPDDGSQPCAMQLGYYFDNGDVPPDDNVPDAGQIGVLVGSGSPTSVRVTTLSAPTGQPSTWALSFLGVAFLSIVTTFVLSWRRKA